MTENAGHQEKGTKKKGVENELMTKVEKIVLQHPVFAQNFQASMRCRLMKTLGFAAVFFDKNFPEMKRLKEEKRAELFAVPTGTQKITVCVLVVFGPQSLLDLKGKKTEDL